MRYIFALLLAASLALPAPALAMKAIVDTQQQVTSPSPSSSSGTSKAPTKFVIKAAPNQSGSQAKGSTGTKNEETKSGSTDQ